ncbi:MAG: nucleotide sugar dehydrogenase [Alphaproteobacteria bacterium]|nr:nucleotide sugar dehydrogenase [Alphaproteobacteria bacterium]
MSSQHNDENALAAELRHRLAERTARIGIVGLGYVGLPLTVAFGEAGFEVVGFDVDAAKIERLNKGESYIRHIPSRSIGKIVKQGRFHATADFAEVRDVDVLLICVPTPLTRQREPDLRFVTQTASAVAPHLRPGRLVVLESTTWPGTTDEVLRPILEEGGLESGVDLFLAYSPEREDPGNRDHRTATIPKVVGGDGDLARSLAEVLYGQIVAEIVPVSSTATAEAVKLTENIFRAVNIALVNELKLVYDRMGIDVWEVIEAAKSKPFGYMPFYPGPGLGGHCIPIDPFYLTWKAREYGLSTRFVELAGEINTEMPRHVVGRLAQALDARTGKGLNGARILVLGVAYKKNVDDTRGSPAFVIIEMLEERGAAVAFHDPYVAEIPPTREHAPLAGRRSIELNAETLPEFDAVLIVTDHDAVDYAALVAHSRLVVDTRNVTRDVAAHRDRIVKA